MSSQAHSNVLLSFLLSLSYCAISFISCLSCLPCMTFFCFSLFVLQQPQSWILAPHAILPRGKPLLCVIMDGVGEGPKDEYDAVHVAHAPTLKWLARSLVDCRFLFVLIPSSFSCLQFEASFLEDNPSSWNCGWLAHGSRHGK